MPGVRADPRLLLNSEASRSAYTLDEARIVSHDSGTRALSEFRTWPGYEVSPLWNLPSIAKRLDVASVHCKDESHRFGLGSFKALGGTYAAQRALARRPRNAPAPVLCCATDGNHGRAVAFAARRHGCRCVVFVHQGVLDSKIAVLRAMDAEVVQVAGNYDDSVDHAERIAASEGWVLISDTSEDAADVVAAEVMQGYAAMALETMDQMAGHWPTHVFLQAGVGGLAAAVAGSFADIAGEGRPTIIVVEPHDAACVMAAAAHGGAVRIQGDLSTRMAMLSCGEVSAPAWEILKHRADAFMSICDQDAADAAESLAQIDEVPGGLAATPSAAAGLAGALATSKAPGMAVKLEISSKSRILFFATEGVEHPSPGK
jgi:diaminopropionate ammonia-lyase